ncbi:peptide chain release factor N(5)-glutamine methyltransferase [Ferrithrix thermotolerans]|nr:peptide chain release factor N(5)-glutamine methyltransferase [Ferrithrix thermotolerans]
MHDRSVELLGELGLTATQHRWIKLELERRIRAHVLQERDSGNWLDQVKSRLLAGEPLQYVLGNWDFRQITLEVDSRVLIPRPETELIVDIALEQLSKFRTHQPGEDLRVIEVGVGSGAVSLSIAKEFDGVDVIGTEISAEALEVAQSNLRSLHKTILFERESTVSFHLGSFFDPVSEELRGKVHVIVTNPPYLSEELYLSASRSVREYEPSIALTPGPTGLEAIEAIATEAPRWLRVNGVLVTEISPEQSSCVQEIFRDNEFGSVHVVEDLTNRARFVVGALKG